MSKLLIVDDEEINRLTLEAGFADLYEVAHAINGKEALEYLYLDEEISAVLLDINMPEASGIDVLSELHETGLINSIPVFIITSSNNTEELLEAYELGAVDVISKPYNIQFLRRRVSNTIELYSQRNNLSRIVQEKTSELIRQNNRLVEAMANIVEFRSNESGTHVKRVKSYTKVLMEGIISEYSEYSNLNDDIEYISFAACLHDLGKIAIPDVILNKPGKYTEEEFNSMKTHTIHGYEQILALKDIMAKKLYDYCIDITRHHHERYDGRGYPDGLQGEKISIWSQVVALADVYDALTSDRCYKKAFTHEKACEMILNGECGAFNPKVINVFTKIKNKFDEIRQEIHKKKILIVDDSEIDCSALRTMLMTNYDVTEVSSGKDALELIANSHNCFDLIIVDVLMPEMDGFEVVQNMGREFVSKTPVVMCSVEVNKEVISKASRSGVRAFIRKPFDFDSVLKKISYFIGE